MDVVGEAADWTNTLAQVSETEPDVLLVEWELIPTNSGSTLTQLRAACPAAVVIVLISQLDGRQQAALSAGADGLYQQRRDAGPGC